LTGWPWPLDGVQNWFDNLYNQVNNAAWSAVNNLWNQIWAKLQWINNAINLAASWLWSKIEPSLNTLGTILTNSFATLGTLVTNSFNTIGKLATDSFNAIGAIAINISNTIGTMITNSFNAIGAFANNSFNAIGTLVTNSLNTIGATINSISSNLQALINNGIKQLQNTISGLPASINKFFTDSTATIIKAIPDSLATAFNLFIKPLLQSLGGEYIEHSPAIIYWTPPTINRFNLIGGWIYEGVKGVLDFVLEHLIYIGGQVLGVLTGFVDTVKDGFMTFINYVLNGLTGALTAGSPPKEIAQPISVMTEALWNKQMDSIDAIYKSTPSGDDTIAAAVFVMAGLVATGTLGMVLGTIADIAHPLKDLGIKLTAREVIYWAGIPSVTAAIAVLPAQIGLLTPLRYALYERWQPLQPEATDLIRMAVRETFIPEELERLSKPGPGGDYFSYMKRLGFNEEWSNRFWAAHWVRPSLENLNNSLYRNLIDIKTWQKEVRLNDYAPYAIDWLQKIIYAPYTRVDIRRMWDIGLVTEKEMLENYKWLGYDDEHAQRMTLWSKAYTIAADIRALYSKGWIDESGARQMITDAGVPKERAEVFLQKLVKSGQADRMTTERDLTKTDILRLFKLGIISSGQAASNLQDIGYDAEEASYLMALYTSSTEITLKELTQAQILKAFRLGIYNRDEAKAKLIEEGWSADSSETLLKLEDINKADASVTKQAERDLSRADIINAINRAIIDKSTGHDYLAYMGYSEWEIGVIFSLEGIA